MSQNNNGLIYLACPYSHPDPAVRERRFEHANNTAAKLIAAGEIVYSPISHTHPMVKYGLPIEFEFYARLDAFFLNLAKTLIVLTLPGWEDSVGVQAEIAIAEHEGLRIEYIEPIDLTEVEGEPTNERQTDGTRAD